MEPAELIELINLVSSKDIAEFEVEREGFRLRMVKVASVAAPQALPATPVVAVESVAARPQQTAAPEPAVEDEHLLIVKTPIVGTFYRSSSPSSEPYVKVGDRVKKGQVLCIVEAMKLMNEIESEVSGVVVDVVAENAQPVEYGEALFKIDPER